MTKKKLKRRKKSRRRKKNISEIKIDQILLKQRRLFLFDIVKNESIRKLIQEIVALDNLSHDPIALYINSPGGSVDDGFALIDIIKGIRSPVMTIIVGQACSMGGIISLAGDKRLMSKHSVVMFHDMQAGIIDYATKIEDRAVFYKKEQKKLFDFIRQHTKLSEKEIRRAITGELWLYPKEALQRGVVDVIIGDEK